MKKLILLLLLILILGNVLMYFIIKAYYRSNIIPSRVSNFLQTKNQIGEKSLKIEIPIERSFDINSNLDFWLAEMIAKRYNLCSNN